MVMSKAVSPHAFSVVEVDFANVDTTRTAIKDEWKPTEGFSLTYLPFISRATIDALAEFPHLNASVGENELVVHGFVDLGIAVDLDYEGLIVPVIREAETKRLRAIAREINDLADRARTRKLMPDEISGGTFTISNNGSAGSVLTMPIINQPQVAILSTDAIVRKPVVVASRPTAARRSPSTRSATWRWRGTTGRSTAPTPPASSSGSRRSWRPRTGPRSCDGRLLRIRWLGTVPYREALAVQQALFDHGRGQHLLLLEHPHVFTYGPRPTSSTTCAATRPRSGPTSSASGAAATSPTTGPASSSAIRSCSSATASARPSTCATSSSSSSTRWRRSASSAGRLVEYPGVWVDADGPDPRKICAIGVRLKRGRTMHGFALNVDDRHDATCASTSWRAASATAR